MIFNYWTNWYKRRMNLCCHALTSLKVTKIMTIWLIAFIESLKSRKQWVCTSTLWQLLPFTTLTLGKDHNNNRLHYTISISNHTVKAASDKHNLTFLNGKTKDSFRLLMVKFPANITWILKTILQTKVTLLGQVKDLRALLVEEDNKIRISNKEILLHPLISKTQQFIMWL